MVYAVVGTGAIGGFFGLKLARSGQQVHFLLRSDYEHVKAKGFDVESPEGSFHLDTPYVYGNVADMPKADVVIVAIKTTGNASLGALLPPLLKPSSTVLLIQNGVGVEEDVQKLLPGVQICGALAFIACTRTAPGHISHFSNNSIRVVNYSCREEAVIDAVIRDFSAAGVPTMQMPYDEGRWWKAVWNMPFNGMTVVAGTQTAGLVNDPKMKDIITALMMEVIGAANACGVPLDEELAKDMIEKTMAMPAYSPSMKVDYDLHRPMEIEYLYSRPIQIAREHGFRMPLMEMLEAELILLDRKNLKNN